MKKAALVLPALLLFTVVFPVFATSGCCSGHGGVNCSAGPQSSGKVICNDGWRGSSCAYSSMVMCQGYSTSNPTPVYTSPTSTPTQTKKPTMSPSPKVSLTVSPSPRVALPSEPTDSPTPTFATTEPTSTPTVESSSEILGSSTTNPENKEPPGALASVIALGVLGGMGYGVYRGIKWVGKKIRSLVSR